MRGCRNLRIDHPTKYYHILQNIARTSDQNQGLATQFGAQDAATENGERVTHATTIHRVAR